MGIRVHELAKKLNIPSKEIRDIMLKLGATKSSNFTVLSDQDIASIETYRNKGASVASTLSSQETLKEEQTTTRRVRRRVKKEEPVIEKQKTQLVEKSPINLVESSQEEKEEPVTEVPIVEKPEDSTKVESIKEVEDSTKVESVKEVEDSKEIPVVTKEPQTSKKKEEKPLITVIRRDAVPPSPLKEAQQENTTSQTKSVSKTKKIEPKTTKESLFNEKASKKARKKDLNKAPKQNWQKKLLLTEVEGEKEEKIVSIRHTNKHRNSHRNRVDTPSTPQVKHVFNERKKDIVIGGSISVSELASAIGIKASDILKVLFSLGYMTTINQSIDGETAALVASEFKVDIKIQTKSVEDVLEQEKDNESELVEKPPVVTVMGHVDHGKTSLLDKIKSTNITGKESGGITQHIAAYLVHTKFGMITFFDTPGHEAFTAMRARGAKVTDIVVLVVAADEGPKAQTAEAIAHAKAAKVPIIVALSKCDKPKADIERTQQQLLEYGLTSESYGGDIPMLPISSHTGEGIDNLLETIQLQAEILELKANPNRLAEGRVIESRLDQGKGNVATILVQRGTLSVGDSYVAGSIFGRVRMMWNDKGKKVSKASPSEPIEITGLSGLPKAGNPFNVVQDEKQARQIANTRAFEEKESMLTRKNQVKLENLFNNMGKDEKKLLTLIIKADVIGSQEAFQESINKLGNEKVGVNIVQATVGGITQTDVTLAMATQSIIIGFNTRPDSDAKRLASSEGIEIRLYSVIYEALEDITKALEGMLEPIIREEIHGKVLVKEIFKIPKIGIIAGCVVSEGKVIRDASVRVVRDNLVIHSSKLASLRRFKDNVKEVSEGMECGISIESYKDLKVNDTLEIFTHFEQKAKL